MKTTITILAAFFFMMNVTLATVRTVSNDPVGGSQFNSLLAGYNASSNGDTLLVEGTNINYSHDNQADWNKNLVVIGIGFNPQKQSPRRTLFFNFYSCCEGVFRITSGGSGSRFYGISFVNEVRIGGGGVSNLTFENCRFDASFRTNDNTVSNFTWRNCVFNNDNGENLDLANSTTPFVSNMLVSNCVFDGYIDGATNQFITLLVDHCLFLGSSTFNQLHFAIIQNSIFMNAFPGGTTNSSFTKNICRVAGTFPPIGGGGNSAAGNLEATNPNFVTYTNNEFYSNVLF